MVDVKRFIEQFKTEACSCCDKKGTCGTQCMTLVQHTVEAAIEEDRKWKAISVKGSGYARADEELATKFRAVAATGDGMVSVHLLSQAADALDRLTTENAQLKRWFADESAHAQEAVKEIAKLREALTKVRADVNERCANQERTMGHAMSWLDYIKQDIDAALASHTEPHTKETT